MKIEQIEQIIEISNAGSLGKAAKNLYISQPTLSLSIKSLEDELGLLLFVRSTKGMVLTDFGKEFLVYSQAIYQHFDILKKMCTNAAQRQSPLTFNLSSMFLKFVNNIFIQLYNQYKNENTYFSFKEASFMDVLKNVSMQASEIGVVFQSSLQKHRNMQVFAQNNVVYTKICDGGPRVLIGQQNPFFNRKIDQITPEMIKNYTFICYESIFNSFSIELSLLGLDKPYNRIIIDDRGTYNELIAKTDGFSVAFWSENPYKNTEYYSNIRAIPLSCPDFSYEIGWIHHKNYLPAQIAQEFLQLLYQVLGQEPETPTHMAT